jgi:hypothetical protein
MLLGLHPITFHLVKEESIASLEVTASVGRGVIAVRRVHANPRMLKIPAFLTCRA